MNISKHEQRVLHVLALGGAIHFERRANGKIAEVACFTRDGHLLEDCTTEVFDRLKKRRFVRSSGSKPYRITRTGLAAVRAQADNR